MVSRRKIGRKLFFVSLILGGFLFFNSSVQAVKVDWVTSEGWQDFLAKVGTCSVARERLEQFSGEFFSDSEVSRTLLRTDRPPIANVQPVVDSPDEMGSLMAAHLNRSARFGESVGVLGQRNMEMQGKFTYVIHPGGEHRDVVITLAKCNWFTNENDGRRYPYQIPSRIAYHLQIKKVINEFGFDRVKTADMWFVFTDPEKSDQEPTDDSIALVSTFIKAERSREAFQQIFELARYGDESALELLKEIILVIRWAGLWHIHERDLLLEKGENFLMAVFVDHECPGIGGNPWRYQDGDEKKINKPWMQPNPDFIKAGPGMGMRELITMLFGIPERDNGQPDVLALAGKFIDFAESDDPSVGSLKEIIS
ncbi:hypothetical protein KAT92_02345 [Candidatus Babeliales bacterium]|nr:hypothetical protein [Candidatus Babeliales bacterium]